LSKAQALPNATVFIHRSNKTRIETMVSQYFIYIIFRFLYIDPIKQGLKLYIHQCCCWIQSQVFIHRSNKTRIETENRKNRPRVNSKFLYIDPIKQGLKLFFCKVKRFFFTWFLYIDPIKQGLKLPHNYIQQR